MFHLKKFFEKPKTMHDDNRVFEKVFPQLEQLNTLLGRAEEHVHDVGMLRADLIDIESLYNLIVDNLEQTIHGRQYFDNEKTGRDSLERANDSVIYLNTPLEHFHEYKTRFFRLRQILENHLVGNSAEVGD